MFCYKLFRNFCKSLRFQCFVVGDFEYFVTFGISIVILYVV